MKNILRKNVLYIILIVVSVGFVISFGCSIQDIVNIALNSDNLSTEWDVLLEYIPVFEDTFDLKDYLTDASTDPYLNLVGGLAQWPVAADATADLSGFNNLDSSLDLDGDGNDDFSIIGIRSQQATLSIALYLVDNTAALLDLSPDDVSIGNVEIEGVLYNFGSPTKIGKVLYYNSTNYLDPNEDYFLNYGGDAGTNYAQYNVEQLDIILNSDATPDYTGANPYVLYVITSANTGEDFEVLGYLDNTIDVYIENSLPVPLSTFGTLESIRDFTLNFIFESHMPFELGMDMTFDAVPALTPGRDVIVSSPGNYSSGGHGELYVSSLKTSETDVTFTGNILDHENMTMDFRIRLHYAPPLLRVSTSDYLKLVINMGGIGTVSF